MRLLKADEIEVRAQQVKEKGCVLLLYKNSRTDMDILDEEFGPMGWQRRHEFKDGKNYCTVSIWDKEKGQWISKEDCGTESNTEKEKGESSDAFKRACVNIGIGRELYTSPFIWVKLTADEVSKTQYQGKDIFRLNFGVKFSVSKIEYNDDRSIKLVEIVDQDGKVRFPTKTAAQITKEISKKKKPFPSGFLQDERYLDQMFDLMDKAVKKTPDIDLRVFLSNGLEITEETLNELINRYEQR